MRPTIISLAVAALCGYIRFAPTGLLIYRNLAGGGAQSEVSTP